VVLPLTPEPPDPVVPDILAVPLPVVPEIEIDTEPDILAVPDPVVPEILTAVLSAEPLTLAVAPQVGELVTLPQIV
tara:strand:- start:1292 stop:1519 length:228 start_codon:yes stop_codon:yes gene_type:complete